MYIIDGNELTSVIPMTPLQQHVIEWVNSEAKEADDFEDEPEAAIVEVLCEVGEYGSDRLDNLTHHHETIAFVEQFRREIAELGITSDPLLPEEQRTDQLAWDAFIYVINDINI